MLLYTLSQIVHIFKNIIALIYSHLYVMCSTIYWENVVMAQAMWKEMNN